jgi:hypothetical protein
MSAQEIAETVMALPEKERLELARRIVASEHDVSARISDAVKGIEDVVTGKVTGLNEDEFRNTLKRGLSFIRTSRKR